MWRCAAVGVLLLPALSGCGDAPPRQSAPTPSARPPPSPAPTAPPTAASARPAAPVSPVAPTATAEGASHTPAVTYPPSPRNVGFIGGACDAPDDCGPKGATCLVDGFPNGMCTLPCTGTCPARGGRDDTKTFCADGKPFGLPLGACLAECDMARLPGTGCPAGYACVERHRFGDPAHLEDVCLPEETLACDGATDRLVAVPYPDAGQVWIPAELTCGGGPADVVVVLHGLNGLRDRSPWVGGGKHLEILVRALIDGEVMRPVVLAEPVHFQATSGGLYGAGFDPARHLALVRDALATVRRTIGTLSYVGHSGAGCNEQNGLYKVLERRKELIPAGTRDLVLWGLADVCYETPYHWEAPLAAFEASSRTVIFNVYSEQGDPTAFEQHLFPAGAALACEPELYSHCLASEMRPWMSLRAKPSEGAVHANNPYFFAREAFPKVFPRR